MLKSKFSTFNDGMLYICKPESEVNSFNAVKNPVKRSDLTRTLKLAFCEMSRRDQDLAFAESQGRTLTIKVKTRYHAGVNKHSQVIIGSVLYSIIHLDIDRAKTELFLYLEEIRELV